MTKNQVLLTEKTKRTKENKSRTEVNKNETKLNKNITEVKQEILGLVDQGLPYCDIAKKVFTIYGFRISQIRKWVNEKLDIPNNYKTISVRLKENQVAVLNSILNQHGLQTLSDYVHALVEGRVDLYKEQVERFAEIITIKNINPSAHKAL